MRKILFLITVFLTSLTFGQTEGYTYAYGNTTLLNLKNAQYEGVEGSPYLDGEEFSNGFMIQNGKKYPNIELRYNAYKDNIEIKISEDEIYATNPNNDNAFIINGRHFVNTKYEVDGKIKRGYLECLNCSGEIKLFKRHYQTYQEAQAAKTGYQKSSPPRFVPEQELYLEGSGDDHAVLLESSNKKIEEQLEPLDKEMKEFIQKEKLKLKKEEDLLRFIEFYNGNK